MRISSFLSAALTTTFMCAIQIPTVLAQENLQMRELFGGKIRLLVPNNFELMPDAARKEKYPGKNAPANALVNRNGDTTTSIAFDHKNLPLEPEQVPELAAPMSQQIAGANKMNSHGVRKLNGVDVLVLDFDSAVPDGTLRNIMAMTSLEGRLLIVSFNCMISRDPGCEKQGEKIIGSLVIAR